MTPPRGLLIALALGMAALAPAADPPLPEDLVILRGQPSVFMVVTTSDVILDSPKQVNCDLAALNADLPAVKFAGRGPVTDADRYWALLGQNPGKYLVPSKELVRQSFENARTGAAGTAFAVSREGIFLTNAHVVGDRPAAGLGDGDWVLIRDRAAADCEVFAKTLGDTTRPADEVAAISRSLLRWYAGQSIAGAKVRSVSIVLEYKVDQAKVQAAFRKGGVAAALSRPLQAEEVVVPATVLAVGESMPGKDVAVLKATFDPAEQAKLIRLNQQRKLAGLDQMLADIQNDRVLCLPLGNSDDVLPQAKVQALGLPESAFNPGIMDAEARYKISARGGEIGQTKKMKGGGGWEAFEMTAAIDHGDSGGPVLDAQGRVIAINMGYAGDRTNPLRLAVPINVAKEYLTKAGVKPDPGKLAAHWEKALRLFGGGKYEECWAEVKVVRGIQEGESPTLSGRQTSWYVKDLGGRCLQKLGKIK